MRDQDAAGGRDDLGNDLGRAFVAVTQGSGRQWPVRQVRVGSGRPGQREAGVLQLQGGRLGGRGGGVVCVTARGCEGRGHVMGAADALDVVFHRREAFVAGVALDREPPGVGVDGHIDVLHAFAVGLDQRQAALAVEAGAELPAQAVDVEADADVLDVQRRAGGHVRDLQGVHDQVNRPSFGWVGGFGVRVVGLDRVR